MNADLPVWRSMLCVPAHVDRLIAGAHTRGADAYILDLEDSVPHAQKEAARRAVTASAKTVSQSGAAVLVRINADAEQAAADLDASIDSAIRGLVLPKVGDGNIVRTIAACVDALEKERRMISGSTHLIAQIEDVHALLRLDEIATSSPRLIGMTLGCEDFSVSAGMQPIPEALLGPNQQVLFACARAGIVPYGLPGSIADYSDLVAFRQLAKLARKLGFVGALCIHPSQIAVLNEEFMPSAAELAEARDLIAAYEHALARGRGAFEYRGRMIDAPIVTRWQQLLRRAQRFS